MASNWRWGAQYGVILWNTETGAMIRRIGNAPRRLFQVTFATDGKTLIAAGGEAGKTGEGRLYEVATGKLLRVFGPRDDTLLCAAWHPDGKHIAMGGADGQIRIHEIETGKETLRYAGHADWVTALNYSRDGTWLATASRDKTARVINPETGKVRSIYRGHQDQVFNVAFNAEGDRVYSGGADQRVHEWMAQDAKRAADFGRMNREPVRLIVTDDTLWVACGDGKAYRYALKDRSRQQTFESGTDWLFGLARHGKQLMAGGPDGKVRRWSDDPEKPQTFAVLPGLP